MRSPPTLPRRRGSLQPDRNWLRPKNRLSDSHPQRENWRPVPLPRPQVERFSKEREASPPAFRQLPFLDREYRTLLHIDVLYDPDAVPRLPYMGASKRRLLAQSR